MGNTSRVILTVTLCMGVLLLWQWFFAPKPTTPPVSGNQAGGTATAKAPATPKKATAPAAAAGSPSAAAEAPAAGGDQGKDTVGPLASTAQGTPVELETRDAKVVLTDRGAVLRSWKLKNPRYVRKVGKKTEPVDLAGGFDRKGPWPLATTFPDSDFVLPRNAKFSLVKKTKDQALFYWKSDKVGVSKHFVFDDKRPLIWLTLTVKNHTQQTLRQRLEVSLFNRQDPTQGKVGMTNPFPLIATVQCHINGEVEMRSAGAIAGEDTGCGAAGCGMGSGPVSQPGELLWIGDGDRYFLTAVVPKDKTEARRCELQIADEERGVVQAAMLHPESKIEPGKARSWRFAVYVGPKELDTLDSVTGPENSEARLAESIEYGWFKVLARPLLSLLKLFHSWFGNWGIAIILLTLVVKLITLYWTQKSMRSMRDMARLKPEMDRMREKYANDKQRLNQEMMNLYKRHKINPLGGCLPMLIQMPVWFALYRTLGNSVELYRSGFAGWITDLTAPDPFYVLPVAMGLAMFGQQAITPQPMEGTQAKMMKYFMPVMFTFMMLWLPSGLTLYIFTNTVLTMLHQWYMNKTDPHKDIKTQGVQSDPAPPQRSTQAGAPGGRKPKARRKNKKSKKNK